MGYRSPPYYSLTVGHSLFSAPADSTVYYFGQFMFDPTTTAVQRAVYIPKTGRIKSGILSMYVAGVVGTNENIIMAIRKNDATDYVFSTVGSTAVFRQFSNYALDIPVTAGDYIEIKLTCPAWVTNPTNVYCLGTLFLSTI
jgi:hypothetical protein